MENKKYCKLVMVTGSNNNKYYEMIYNGGSTFTVNYGRVESSKTTIQKPIGQWDRLIRSKLKKGYKDVTHLASVEVKEEKTGKVVLKQIDDETVNNFLNRMKQYTDNLVDKTYSVKSESVSQSQVDEAQIIIDKILGCKSNDHGFINTYLLELYTVIPRRMTNVQDYLMPSIQSSFEKVMIQEQDNLDAMAAQVAENTKKEKELENTSEDTIIEETLLDMLGIKMFPKSDSDKNIDYILKQLKGLQVKGVYEVKKQTEDQIFFEWLANQENKETRYLIHGTRCTSVIPILEQGLKIRPTGNFQFSGKVYGNGNYFSEVTKKSLGYTGYDDDQVLLVYEVHTGNPFVYEGWYRGNQFKLCYEELQKRGFDSTYVNAGNGLLNSEIIAYKEQQCRIKYAIWLKR